MRAAADYLEDLGDAAVDLLTRELGCPRWFAQRAHVPNPLRHLRYYAGLIETEQTDEPRTDGTNHSLVVREPVGVVGAITPVERAAEYARDEDRPRPWRPAARSCSSRRRRRRSRPTCSRTRSPRPGLPEGVLSVVPADREVGEHLVRHRDVDKIAFTGSTAAGRRIMALCAERIARVTLELGGKSAAIMLDDADLEHLVRSLVPMAMMVNGQALHRADAACSSRGRGRPRSPTRSLRPSPPCRWATRSTRRPRSARSSASGSAQRVEGYLSLAAQEGARVIGGGRPRDLGDGYYVCPALLTDVDNAMRVAQEEIFGPVVAVIPYDDETKRCALRTTRSTACPGRCGRPTAIGRSRSPVASGPGWSA